MSFRAIDRLVGIHIRVTRFETLNEEAESEKSR